MKQLTQSRVLKSQWSSERSQLTQSGELHKGQNLLPGQSDPQFAVAFSLPQQEVLDIFEAVATHLNFQMIEKQEAYATAIKRSQSSSILDFLNCLSWWGQANRVSAVKLTVINNSKLLQASYKLCRVKVLSNSADALAFIDLFRQKMANLKGVTPSKYVLEPVAYFEEHVYENNSNPFHLQACAYYTFNKILTSQSANEHRIRDKIEKSLGEFFEAFKNIEESSQSLPTPLLNLIGIVKQTGEQISGLLKIERGDSGEKFSQYMKISIQKYIFDRTEIVLKAMYVHRDSSVTGKFLGKRQKIVQSLTRQQIYEQVLLNTSIKSIETGNGSTRAGIQFCELCCPELEKISGTSSPREKIKHCQLMYAQLKSYFYQKLSMKYELNTMEDIIPVFIVVVLFANVPYLRSELNLMMDFIHGADEDFEAEKRMLVNLSESYNYVVRDWNI